MGAKPARKVTGDGTELERYGFMDPGDDGRSKYGVWVKGRLAGRMEERGPRGEMYVVPVHGKIFSAKNQDEAIARLRETVL